MMYIWKEGLNNSHIYINKNNAYSDICQLTSLILSLSVNNMIIIISHAI